MGGGTHSAPDGSLKLHQLCNNCTQFIRGSGNLGDNKDNEYNEGYGDDEDDEDDYLSWMESIADYKLCTIAHLKEMDGVCHLCTKIHYQLILCEGEEIYGYDKKFSMTDEYFSNKWVILEGDSYSKMGLDSLKIYVGECCSGPYLKRLHVRFYIETEKDVFGTYIASSHVPLRAEHHIARMQEWLQTCMSKHQECKASMSAKIVRPSRILELGSLPGDKVVLRCDCSNSTEFRYLALSHMWGSDPSQQLRLVESRLQEFQNEVPWNEMSLLFQEAVRITRAIGYQYLWIDSLCIIQDSQSDWNVEAVRMAGIYGNADCSIAYLFPPTDIRTKPRKNLHVLTSCVAHRGNRMHTGLYFETPLHDLRRSCDWFSRKNWPLFSRAWALQEHLLSPRTIFVGHHNLMWECLNTTCDELVGKIGDDDITLSKRQFLQLQSYIGYQDPNKTKATQYMISWETLVRSYRKKKLTKPEDRIVAFSGVTQAIQKVSGMTYLAGSWRELFPYSLLWVLSLENDGNDTSRIDYKAVEETVVHDVPSWSWLSLPIYRASNIRFLLQYHDLGRLDSVILEEIFDAEFCSVQKSSTKQNDAYDGALYDFSGLSITVHAMICQADAGEFSKSLEQTGSFYRHFHDSSERYTKKPTIFFWPDQPLNYELTGNITLVLLREYELHDFRYPTFSYHCRTLVGLILLPGHGDGTYKRVGLWSVCVDLGDETKRSSLFEGILGARKEVITLV